MKAATAPGRFDLVRCDDEPWTDDDRQRQALQAVLNSQGRRLAAIVEQSTDRRWLVFDRRPEPPPGRAHLVVDHLVGNEEPIATDVLSHVLCMRDGYDLVACIRRQTAWIWLVFRARENVDG